MKIKTVAFAVAAALASVGAQAADDNLGKGYAVLSVGFSKADLGDAEDYYEGRAASYRTIPGVTANVDVEDTDFAFALGAGFRVNANLAIEGYYRSYGKFEAGVTATDSIDFITEKSEFEASGLGVGLIGLVPVSPVVSLYARADLVSLKAEQTYSETTSMPSSQSVSIDDTNVKLGIGLGAQFDLQSGFSLRLDYQQIEAEIEDDSADLSSLNVGLLKSF